MRTRTLFTSLAVGLALVASACSESTPTTAGTSTTTGTSATADCVPGPSVTSVIDCHITGSMLSSYMPAKPTKATGTPIQLGTINQDTGATGAFPELTAADKTAFDFINDELGGVDGHPLVLTTCNTNFSPDLSQSCAQTMVSKKVVAVIGGIDVWGTGIATLAENKGPLVGGIPVSFDSMRSPYSFQFSGGTWGAALGMSEYAVDTLKAKKIAIIYSEFPPITDSAKLAQRAVARHGGTAVLISTPPIGADMVAAINQAASTKPDAIVALTADAGCVPTIRTAQQLQLTMPVMLTGACAATKIVDELGPAIEGKVFNLEAELDQTKPDNRMYRAIVERYGPKYNYQWQGAGTVSFRAVMNLYVQMRKIGADKLSPATITAALRATHDEPSFFGHPYTCDGKQLDGYPSICTAQQTLGKISNAKIVPVTGWLDVAAWAR